MNMPLARYLKDFSTAPVVAAQEAPAFDLPDEEDMDPDFPPVVEPPPVDIEALQREAYAQGHEAGEAAANERHEIERQAREVTHAQALAERDQRLSDDIAKALSTQLPQIIRSLSEHVSAQAAIALAPVVGEALADKAVKELADLLETAILSGEAGSIKIRGPRALYQKLLSEMPDRMALFHHVEDEDLDLTAEFGDAALVTRISAFSASLKKVLA